MEYTSKEVYEYISKQLNDRIVEWKKCRLSWQEFPIYQSDLDFYDKVSPTFEVSQTFVDDFLNQFFEGNELINCKDIILRFNRDFFLVSTTQLFNSVIKSFLLP